MNFWERNQGHGILHLRTPEAAAIFENEIKGQLSDGAWENSKPYDHWIFWAHTEPVVDGNIGLEIVDGRPVKRGYNLNQLIEYVGDRMLAYVIGAKLGKDPELTEYLIEWTDTMKNPGADSYWIKKSEQVKKEFGNDLDKAKEEALEVANMSDVRKALTEIRKAMTTNYNPNKPFKTDNKEEQKMQQYFDKGSNPVRLINDIKNNIDKLESRYVIAKNMGWEDYYKEIERRAELGDIAITTERLKQLS